MKEKEILTVEEVAGELRVSPRTVRGWIGSGDLVAIDVGREYRINRRDFEAFIEKRRTDKKRKQIKDA
jgi:excisionase family DNA binding protein